MPLAIYTSAAWTANGGLEPASQALVTVRNEATGALASVFSDRAGNNGLGNPFNADDQGRFSFYASGGAFRIEVESDGLTQELRYQAIGTSAEYDLAQIQAIANSGVYETTADGIADTTDGDYFWVPSDDTLDLYQNDAGSADKQDEYPNLQLINTILNEAVSDAEDARDAAQQAGNVYDTTTDGLAATSDGDYFSVPESGSLFLYRNDAGSATQILNYAGPVGTLSEHESPTDVEKVARLDRLVDGGQINTGLTESVTLSTGTLTIPVGMSTIKLPTSVWDGSSNITISAIAFEGGVQPAVGYEFSVVVPKTTTAGSLTAGALGNEVLIQDGASIAVEANNNADLPCYPNAADNPDADPVQFAAPYYRLDFRVDSYDGGGDPVVSLVRMPGPVFASNDAGSFELHPQGAVSIFPPGGILDIAFDSSSRLTGAFAHPVIIPEVEGITSLVYGLGSISSKSANGVLNLLIGASGSDESTISYSVVDGSDPFVSGDDASLSVSVLGRWY